MFVKVTGVAPVFVMVTVCAALVWPLARAAKVRLAGLKLMDGVARPLPESETLCPPALSLIVKLPVRTPITVGVKVTLMVQVAPSARFAGQSLVWKKSPLMVIPLMVAPVFPLLVSVIPCNADVVFTTRSAKVSAVVDGFNPGVAGAVEILVTNPVLLLR